MLGLNGTAGFGRVDLERKPTQLQERALTTMRQTTRLRCPWTCGLIEAWMVQKKSSLAGF